MPDECTQGPVPTSPGQPTSFVVDQGTLYARPNGGSLRVPRTKNVRFESDYLFKVEFTQIAGTPYDWPSPPVRKDGNRYIADTQAPNVPDTDLPYYKYTVTIGKLKLDPIVIVDK